MFTIAYFMRKLCVSILAAFLLSLSLVLISYTPSTDRIENIYYWGFGEILLIFLIYSLPVYLIGGNGYSILVDYLRNKTRLVEFNRVYSFIINLIIYAFGGCIVSILFVLVLGGNLFSSEVYGFVTLGAIGAILYYVVDTLVLTLSQFIIRRR